MKVIKKLLRKGRKDKGKVTQREPDFPALGGMHYIDFLGQFHARRNPATYLEIGTQKGPSLAQAKGTCIAIDPEFRLKHDVLSGKSDVYFYQGTSDEFFASGYLEKREMRLDFAFLDGMHLFEFLLRDFINAERFVTIDGTIALHDCVPYARVMTTRSWEKSVTRSWTGDVWKLLPILRKYRPDLNITVLDCTPTGLVLIDGLDRKSSVLSDAYEKIVAEYMDLTLDQYGVDTYVNALNLVNSNAYFDAAPA